MILVTGFAPYKEDMNASGTLVQSLIDDLPQELVSIKDKLAFAIIECDDTSRETEHHSLETQLTELLQKHEPELCIFTGQAPPCNKITIEKIGANSFMGEVIDRQRPVAYWSDLPGTDKLRTILEQKNIPADYSFDAGQHLCNHILFSSLYLADSLQLAHKSGFIHIPLLPEQVIHNIRTAACMPVDMTRIAICHIINHTVRQHKTGGHN